MGLRRGGSTASVAPLLPDGSGELEARRAAQREVGGARAAIGAVAVSASSAVRKQLPWQRWSLVSCRLPRA
jgi:hypothetical protein